MRAFLCFGDSWSVELQQGTTVLGRDVGCDVQLRDDAVSRRHLRLTLDDQWTLTVLDLGSTNGSQLNGLPLQEAESLRNGDTLLIGHVLGTVRLLQDDDPRVASLLALHRRRPPSRQPHGAARATSVQLKPLGCAKERRREHRVRASVPVRFCGQQSSYTTTVHNLSLGGAFVVSEQPEVPGPCRVTLLPKDSGPLEVSGHVQYVIPSAQGGHPPGFGVKFTQMDRRSWLWLQGLMARHEEPWVYGEGT